ncbi:MAG: RagB/SusD family nutrient uptake outer membrane protein [Bacteroidota bacterium]|nr:RagB/SusD family nutrient uptake outer membrane protein [Bacteroidota bacterium]
MKNLYKLLIGASIIVLISACNFLEPEALSLTTEEDVFSNYSNLTKLRNDMFNYLPGGYNTIGNSWRACATDEAEEVGETENIQNFNSGNWNMYSNPDNVWATNYKGIRKTFDFMQGSDTITFSEYKNTDPVSYSARVIKLKMWRAEAKFLRAFFYFELLKRYGGVPIVDRKFDIVNDYAYLRSIKRNSFAENVENIVALCDSAAKYLPVKQSDVANTDWGIPTKGAALALKARTLLYAASDLYNQAGNTNPLIGYTDNKRTERWIRAASANKAVLDMMPLVPYSFQSTYPALFLLKTLRSNEVIFERRYPASNTFETLNYPIGYQSGKTGTCPSQNLIDAYEMKTGEPFDWNNPVHAANPYNNRDPRLQMTIIVNNSIWKATNVQLWEGGANGKPIYHASKTGYYLKKYVDESLNLTIGQTSAKQWIFFRLSEIYLNYSEAMNEVFGPGVVDTFKISALQAVNSVRTRAGVGMPAIPSTITKEDLRAKIRNERRIELAFEDQRFWDVRRWMIGESTLGATIRGVNITKKTDGTFTYVPFDLEKRIFTPNMYFYPIPQSEIIKGGGNIEQNPGWN